MLDITVYKINPNDTNGEWIAIQDICEKLLRACDKTQLPDSGLSFAKQLEWRNYRDDLKSIRDDFDNPDDVILPTQPEEE